MIPYDQVVRPFSGFSEETGRVTARLRETFLTKTRDEWLEILHKADTCVAPVHTSMDEVLEDPQVKHRQMMVEVDDPVLGKIKQPGVAIKMSDTPGGVRTLSPVTGSIPERYCPGWGTVKKRFKNSKNKGRVV